MPLFPEFSSFGWAASNKKSRRQGEAPAQLMQSLILNQHACWQVKRRYKATTKKSIEQK